ncbi:protein of unassigned function [Methylobacterium oryzae CBMB20]|uniref:Protein of unassigned function n=1 Tax=Methylobacterium oryzae CBMB20 TaxID=693986 RepID=A0A089NZN9_9HYPH|nr:protein of unassigned function [Methylobacterium oryzae CBMB20]
MRSYRTAARRISVPGCFPSLHRVGGEASLSLWAPPGARNVDKQIRAQLWTQEPKSVSSSVHRTA